MRRGYSLIEVMVALAILAVSLSILIGTQANSVHMTERANQMALAALLARSKMIDVEHELLQEGFSDVTEEMSGDFRDQNVDDFEWEALIEVVELPPEAEEQLVSEVTGTLFGSADGEEDGALSAAPGVSSMLPMAMSMVPGMVNELGKRMRKVTLSVSWPDGEARQSLTVQQFVVNLNPGGAEGEPPPPTGIPLPGNPVTRPPGLPR